MMGMGPHKRNVTNLTNGNHQMHSTHFTIHDNLPPFPLFQLSSNSASINAFRAPPLPPQPFKYSLIQKLSLISPHHNSHALKEPTKMNTKTSFFLFAFLLIAASLSFAIPPDFFAQIEQSPKGSKPNHQNNKGGGNGGGFGGFFGPGSGFNIPGFGSGSGIVGGGYGGGFGGPSGGSSRSGVIRPTIVCREKGPCYKKTLICPAKCFTSYSRSGKGYGGGGGGGGCTVDCKKRCTAYC